MLGRWSEVESPLFFPGPEKSVDFWGTGNLRISLCFFKKAERKLYKEITILWHYGQNTNEYGKKHNKGLGKRPP